MLNKWLQSGWMWRVLTWDIFDLCDKKRAHYTRKAARLRVSPNWLLLLVNGFRLHPVIIQQALPSYLYPPNAKTCPRFVQTIVCPIWLHSQRFSTTCTITNKQKNCATHCPHWWPSSVCFIPLPLVGAHAPAPPYLPSQSKSQSRSQAPGGARIPAKAATLQQPQ